MLFKSAKEKIIAAGAGAGALALLGVVGAVASFDFTAVIAALMALCGLVVYDIAGRRAWEKAVTKQVETLARNHDRLVREVARSRNDIAFIKEGFADIAQSIAHQARRLPPAATAEARMIETIVSQLGAMGEKSARAQIQTKHDENILELEMAPPPRPVSFNDIDSEMAPDFTKLSDSDIRDMLQHAVRDNRIDVFTQPIVSLPQRTLRMIEVFGRLRAGPGAYMPASRYLDLAHKDSLVPALDNLLLLHCLQMLRDRQRIENGAMPLPYMINISASTLHDTGFMGDLVAFLAKHKNMAPRLIFELPQAEVNHIDESVIPVLDGLSQLGCRFSMDRVRSRTFDIHRLKRLHIRFLKMEAAWLITEGRQRGGVSRINRLKKQLDSVGIDMIVEKIEKESDVRELLDFSVDYGQGYLFGKPDLTIVSRKSLKEA